MRTPRKIYFFRRGKTVLAQTSYSRIKGVRLEVVFLATFIISREDLDENSDHILARYLRKELFRWILDGGAFRFRIRENRLKLGIADELNVRYLIERIVEILFAWQEAQEVEAISRAESLLKKAGI